MGDGLDDRTRDGEFPRNIKIAPILGDPAGRGAIAFEEQYNSSTIGSSTNPSNALLPFVPVGAHVQNTDLDIVVEIPVPAGAHQWMVQCQNKDVRFTLDSATEATSTIGFLVKADAPPVIVPVVPNQVIHVIETAASAKLDYQFGA